jgi:hypothetical protein
VFGHDWQPGEGTLVDSRGVKSGSGEHAHVTRYFLMDVQPSSGESFRCEVKEPLLSSSFVAPSVPGEKVTLKCDPGRKEARFDGAAEKADRKAAKQADADHYQSELHANVGSGVPRADTGGDDVGSRLERLTQLHDQGELTDADYEAQTHEILRSS